jgi:hypothetical protein
MQILKKQKTRRVITARFFAVAITLVLLLSIAFLVKEASHECTGAGCPICAMMEQCSNTIRLLGTGAMMGALVTFPCLDSIRSQRNNNPVFLVYASLVTQNVRMND